MNPLVHLGVAFSCLQGIPWVRDRDGQSIRPIGDMRHQPPRRPSSHQRSDLREFTDLIMGLKIAKTHGWLIPGIDPHEQSLMMASLLQQHLIRCHVEPRRCGPRGNEKPLHDTNMIVASAASSSLCHPR